MYVFLNEKNFLNNISNFTIIFGIVKYYLGFSYSKIWQIRNCFYGTFLCAQTLKNFVCPQKNILRFFFTYFRGLLSTFSGNSSESPYYPLGSEASMRPFSPKFIIEENSSNYEPVMVSNRALAVTPVIGISPMLPKRYVVLRGLIIYFFL